MVVIRTPYTTPKDKLTICNTLAIKGQTLSDWSKNCNAVRVSHTRVRDILFW